MSFALLQGATSTHALLLELLASELGLRPVMAPDNQHLALGGAFESLRDRVLTQLRAPVAVSLRALGLEDSLEVPGTRDAELFTQLYRPMNTFGSDATALLTVHVYPLIGRMVRGNERLAGALRAALGAHCERYGEGVRGRIAGSLGAFRLPADYAAG